MVGSRSHLPHDAFPHLCLLTPSRLWQKPLIDGFRVNRRITTLEFTKNTTNFEFWCKPNKSEVNISKGGVRQQGDKIVNKIMSIYPWQIVHKSTFNPYLLFIESTFNQSLFTHVLSLIYYSIWNTNLFIILEFFYMVNKWRRLCDFWFSCLFPLLSSFYFIKIKIFSHTPKSLNLIIDHESSII